MSAFSDVARAAIEAAWPPGRVYAPREAPDGAQTPYVVMYGDSGRDAIRRNDGTAGAEATRLMPMAVGATEDEVDRAVAAIKRGLRGKRLTAGGYTTTPIELESSSGYLDDPDGNGVITSTLFLTFHAFEENP